MEDEIVPVKKVKGGWKVVSYSTGKTLKRKYKTKKAAQNRASTSRRRSKGQWFDILSTDGNWTVTCQAGDTLNGVAGATSVTRNTNYGIYRVICIANNTWAINNPE